MGATLTVLRPGPLTTVQDLGRPGYAHLGVPPSGAADAPALRLANRLAGNDLGTAALELTLGGLTVVLSETRWAALAGAPAPLTVDGRPADPYAPVEVPAGARLAVRTPATGVRSYLAIGGGFAVAPVLGSRATDVLSGLGPAPLAAGAVLPLGAPAGGPGTAVPVPDPDADRTLRLYPGPRADWFTGAALDRLTGCPYEVSADSNRVGVRLRGPAMPRRDDRELPSEGLVTGAVQVPADGQPLLFLTDHPTTGGYPVIGVVHPDDLPLAAQARPGSSLRFRLR
jgi:biotin-dependent carboxylase-like uncharacterized protein